MAAATTMLAQNPATFTRSATKLPGLHRTSPAIIDINNDGKMDILYGGSLNPDLDKKAGIWGWTTTQTLLTNNGNDNWTIDTPTAEKDAEPQKDENGNTILGEDGQPKYNWHIVPPKHGIRASCYNQYAGIDYNNDGLVDILLFGQDGSDDWYMPDEMKVNHLTLYRNNGDGTFSIEEKAVFPACSPDNDGRGFSLAVADYDRDGYVDFFVCGNLVNSEKPAANYPSRIVALYRNIDGTGEFKRMDIAQTKGGVYTAEVTDDAGNVVTPREELPGWFLPIGGNVHFADINNDGWVDLLFAGWADDSWDPDHAGAGNQGRIYLNRNGEKFEDVTPSAPTFYTLRSSSTSVADFDSDGYLDWFMTGYGDNGWNWNAFLYTNTTDENNIYDTMVTASELGVDGQENVKQFIRDFDGDGNLDIFYSNYNNKITIFHGSMTGSFTKAEYTENPFAGSAYGAVGDVNGNGLSDILQLGYGDNGSETWLYYNTTPVTPEAPEAPANVTVKWADGKLTISWDEISDYTTAINIFVKNAQGQIYSLVPADIETGFVKVAMDRTVCLRPDQTSYSIDAPEGSYTVGVQTVSLANETYSPFTTATIESSGIEDIISNSDKAIQVTTDADGIFVAGNGEAVKVINTLGQTIATGVAGQHIAVDANGVLIVTMGNETAKVIK